MINIFLPALSILIICKERRGIKRKRGRGWFSGLQGVNGENGAEGEERVIIFYPEKRGSRVRRV